MDPQPDQCDCSTLLFLAEDCTEGLWPVASAESSCRSQRCLHLNRKGKEWFHVLLCMVFPDARGIFVYNWDSCSGIQLRIRKHQYWCPSSSALTAILLSSLFRCRIIFRDVKLFALLHLCSFVLKLNDFSFFPDLLQKCFFPAWQLLGLFSVSSHHAA